MTEQPSLFADRVPAADDAEPAVASFDQVERRWLDDTSWVEIVRACITGGATLLRRIGATAAFEQRRRWMFNELVDEPRLTAEFKDVADVPDDLRFLSTLAGALSDRYGVHRRPAPRRRPRRHGRPVPARLAPLRAEAGRAGRPATERELLQPLAGRPGLTVCGSGSPTGHPVVT